MKYLAPNLFRWQQSTRTNERYLAQKLLQVGIHSLYAKDFQPQIKECMNIWLLYRHSVQS